MEDVISIQCGAETLHIGSLSRQTVIDAGAEHMGAEGYFIFTAGTHGVEVLSKAVSMETALRLADIIGAVYTGSAFSKA